MNPCLIPVSLSAKLLRQIMAVLFVILIVFFSAVPVAATVVDELQCSKEYIGYSYVVLRGDISFKMRKEEQGILLLEKGTTVPQKMECDVTLDTFVCSFYVDPDTAYEAKTYLIYKDLHGDPKTVFSETIRSTTKALPKTTFTLTHTSSSTAQISLAVATNDSEILDVRYQVFDDIDCPYQAVVSLGGIATDTTFPVYIENLEEASNYSLRVSVYSAETCEPIITSFAFKTKSIVIPTPSPTITPTHSPTSTPKPTATPTVKPTHSATATPKPTTTPTVKPTLSATATPTPTATPAVSPTTNPDATPVPTTTPAQNETSADRPNDTEQTTAESGQETAATTQMTMDSDVEDKSAQLTVAGKLKSQWDRNPLVLILSAVAILVIIGVLIAWLIGRKRKKPV